ncbi:cytochrome P450 [Flammeovirga aprica]|uniref:Cytochrome P450 n=1 Tax=Flammeovirga aprica JL-4 TaxID=694437 RepID=A0A7X9S0X9_9BACT|nr:cytochrome P450 [Flammeovirga aprica]NME72291.1 cytochrome P450 [Flammeovirga aprica JL-4]
MKKLNYSKSINNLKGPKGIPFIGNLLQINKEKLHQNLEQWAKKYGDFYKINFPGLKIVVVSNPYYVNEILNNRPNKFRRLSKMKKVLEEMGFYGTLSSEGEEWKKHRKVTQQALSHKNVENYFPLILKIGNRLEEFWANKFNGNKYLDNYEISQDFMNATIDITTNLAFGCDLNTVYKQKEITQQHISKVVPKLNERIVSPFPLWRYIKTASDRDFDKSMKTIKDIISLFIENNIDNLKRFPERKKQPTNFLEALLVSQDKENPFSWEEIYGNIFTMLLTGEDTTANSLAWFSYYMATNKSIQYKIRNEIHEVLGEEFDIKEIGDTKKFKYLTATIKEVLRLKPVAPILYLQSNEDVILKDTLFPKNTFFITLLRYGGIDEKYFSKPNQIIPERWMQKESKCPFEGKHKEDVILTFGAGPRYCPGKYLAEIEMIVFIIKLIKNYEIELSVPEFEISEKFDFTMTPENLKVKLTMIKSNNY